MGITTVSPVLVEIRHLDIPATFGDTIYAHELLRELMYQGHGFGHIPEYAMLSRDSLRHMAMSNPICPYSEGFCKAIRDEYHRMKVKEWTRKAS